MTLPSSPPRYGSWGEMLAPIRRGDTGWPVYALQRALGIAPADGVFDPGTLRAVKRWQADKGLAADGIAGPATQGWILRDTGRKADRTHGLPEGLGYGFAIGEGGGILAATNWSVAGGVDCGPAQWRVSGPPFDRDLLVMAFRPYQALERACARLRNAQRDYLRRNTHWTDPQEALNVAVLQHNWPAGADSIVRNYRGGGAWWRHVPSPDSPATWVRGFTRAEWAKHYPATILRFTA